MAKLTIKNKKQLNIVLNKLTPSWSSCFDEDTLSKAQVTKSQPRNFVFGTIINAKFIKLSRASAGFKAGSIVSLCDIYVEDSASNIASLIIYRLGHSGLVKQPTVVEA